MPAFCAVVNCHDKYGHLEKVTFHRFPIKRKELLEKWLEFTERDKSWKPNRYSAICARHFNDVDYNHNDRKKKLKKTAIPTIRTCKLNKKTDDVGLSKHLVPEITMAFHEPSTPPLSTPTIASPHFSKKSSKVSLLQKPKEVCAADDSETSSESEATTSDTADSEDEEDSDGSMKTSQPTIPPNSHCRFCGTLTIAITTFAANFEVFGMIQKCLPTLNIQQNDPLPKDICAYCFKCLHGFSEFIDRVLEAQNSLQTKFKTERQDRKVEKHLKIKQEPMIRVKQEMPDANQNSNNNELEDDGYDPENEHKFPFDDFPLLNAPEGINDADIMEIINLDDPFINIPDDDGNNTNDSSFSSVEKDVQKDPAQEKNGEMSDNVLPLGDHNYSLFHRGVLKQEFQSSQSCKVEKLDFSESLNVMDSKALAKSNEGGRYENYQKAKEENSNEKRSTKPVVYVVSSLTLPPQPLALAEKNPPTKPNIVVLNDERIVKPSNAFQLQACNICSLKFFSLESLQQHFVMAHNTFSNELPYESANSIPMVSVPQENLTHDFKELIKTGKDHSNNEKLSSSSSLENQEAATQANENFEVNEHAPNGPAENGYGCDQYFLDDYALEQTVETTKEDESADTYNDNLVTCEENVNQEVDHAEKDSMPPPSECERPAPSYNNPEGFPPFVQNSLYTESNMQQQVHQPSAEHQNNLNLFSSQNPTQDHSSPYQANGPMHLLPSHLAFANEHHSSLVQKPSKQKIFINDVNILNVQQSFSSFNNQTMMDPFAVPVLKSDYDESVQEGDTEFECPTEYSCDNEGFKNGAGAGFVYAKPSYEQWQQGGHSFSLSRPNQLQTSTGNIRKRQTNDRSIKKLSLQYKQLKGICLQLLRKCELLEKRQISVSAHYTKNQKFLRRAKKYSCKFCNKKFMNFKQLLSHKQTSPQHRIIKPKIFAGKCSGCSKFFSRRLAYNNHKRYICFSISLRDFTKRLQAFRCRYCKTRGFPHWRIYCRHLQNCKEKQKLKNFLERKRRNDRNSKTKKNVVQYNKANERTNTANAFSSNKCKNHCNLQQHFRERCCHSRENDKFSNPRKRCYQ